MKRDRDPTVIILTEEAKQEVADHGSFKKHDAIQAVGFGPFESKIIDLVPWDAIRENVEAESGAMIPIAEVAPGEWDMDVHPEKFLSGGGRKCAGYALASQMPGPAMEYVRRRFATVNGMLKGLDSKVLSFQKQGLAIAYTPGSAPQLAIAAE